MLDTVKGWIAALTEIGLLLIALAIVIGILVGGQLPFFGDVVKNLTTLIDGLGKSGLVGLIAIGVILWLFSHRKLS